MARDLQDVRVREVMTSDPITVPGDLSVEDVLHEFMLRYHCSSFPVVDAAGHVTGLVTLRRLRALPAHRRSTTRVADIAQPMSEVAQAAPDELLLDVLPRTARSQDGRLLVFDADTRLVGIVSSSDIARVVQIAEVEHAR